MHERQVNPTGSSVDSFQAPVNISDELKDPQAKKDEKDSSLPTFSFLSEIQAQQNHGGAYSDSFKAVLQQ